MSSILNSISSGDLQVPQQAPGDFSPKEDSIIDLLQNSEIEFKTCPHTTNKLDDMNTGFGEGQELHYDTPCKKPELKTPLYRDNYLNEFVTEEEKAAVRHALGIHTKSDLVTAGSITLSDGTPSVQAMIQASLQQLKKRDSFVAPITLTRAVFNSDGETLDATIKGIKDAINKNTAYIDSIVKETSSTTITSVGDIRKFLQGFNNGDNLQNTLATINAEMLRFEQYDINT